MTPTELRRVRRHRLNPHANIWQRLGAVWAIDARYATPGERYARNLGWAGPALNAQYGSSASPNTNDPTALPFDPAVGTYLQTSGAPTQDYAATALEVVTWADGFEIVALANPDSWFPSVIQTIGAFAQGASSPGRTILLYIFGTGQIGVGVSDGTPPTVFPASPQSMPAGTTGWQWVKGRGRWVAGSLTVEFSRAPFTPNEPTAWIPMGSTVSALAGTINPGAMSFVVNGGYPSAAAGHLAGGVS